MSCLTSNNMSRYDSDGQFSSTQVKCTLHYVIVREALAHLQRVQEEWSMSKRCWKQLETTNGQEQFTFFPENQLIAELLDTPTMETTGIMENRRRAPPGRW